MTLNFWLFLNLLPAFRTMCGGSLCYFFWKLMHFPRGTSVNQPDYWPLTLVIINDSCEKKILETCNWKDPFLKNFVQMNLFLQKMIHSSMTWSSKIWLQKIIHWSLHSRLHPPKFYLFIQKVILQKLCLSKKLPVPPVKNWFIFHRCFLYFHKILTNLALASFTMKKWSPPETF